MFAGLSAVVMGSGPSLHFVDDRVYKHVTIAVNDAVGKFHGSDFYFTADPLMHHRRHWWNVKWSKCKVAVGVGLFENDWLRGMTFEKDGIQEDRIYECEMGDPQNRDLHMRREDTRLLVGSSANSAAHFAVILGCDPIYLIGCECCIIDGRRYYWQHEGENFVGGDSANTDLAGLRSSREEPDHGLSGFVVRQWEIQSAQCQCATLYDASGGMLSGVLPTKTIEEILA